MPYKHFRIYHFFVAIEPMVALHIFVALACSNNPEASSPNTVAQHPGVATSGISTQLGTITVPVTIHPQVTSSIHNEGSSMPQTSNQTTSPNSSPTGPPPRSMISTSPFTVISSRDNAFSHIHQQHSQVSDCHIWTLAGDVMLIHK